MIKTEELYWLAGLLEAEGCFTRLGNGAKGHGLNIQIQMSDEDVVTRARGIMYPSGHLFHQQRGDYKTQHRLTITGPLAVSWMMTLYPYLSLRRKERIRELLAYWRKYPVKRKDNWRRGPRAAKLALNATQPFMRDLFWVAGLIEGDGCFYTKPKGEEKIVVQMTDLDTIVRVRDLMKITSQITTRAFANKGSTKPTYMVEAHGKKGIGWMQTLYPLMGRRRKEKINECLHNWRSRNYSRRALQFCTGC